ncbi:hydrophobin 2 [Moniliophthora roreri]|nr:hydrophobin 2 [Moniliophthora roreri]
MVISNRSAKRSPWLDFCRDDDCPPAHKKDHRDNCPIVKPNDIEDTHWQTTSFVDACLHPALSTQQISVAFIDPISRLPIPKTHSAVLIFLRRNFSTGIIKFDGMNSYLSKLTADTTPECLVQSTRLAENTSFGRISITFQSEVDVDGGAANGNNTICKEKQVSQRIATNTNDRDGVTLDTNGDVQILDNDTREPESLCDVLVLSVIDSLAALDIAGVALGTIVATWGGDDNCGEGSESEELVHDGG